MIAAQRWRLFGGIVVLLFGFLPALQTLAQAAGCAATLTLGTSVLCTLASPGGVDQYTLTASAGDTIVVRAASRNAGLQPRIRVLAPGGAITCQAQTFGSLADTDACVLSVSGSYTVQIDDGIGGTDVGTYGLAVQRMNSPVGAGAFASGQQRAAALVLAGELDTYTIDASALDRLILRMGSASADLKPLLRLYSSTGTKLCEASSYSSVAEFDTCALPSTGTYTLLVSAFSDSATGSYYLALQQANNPSAPVPLAFGAPSSATLAQAAELDSYNFTADAQQPILIRMGTSGLKPQLRLYSAAGIKLCEGASFSAVAEMTCVLPSSPSYTLIVSAYGEGSTGSYSLSMQRLGADASGPLLAAGVTTTSVLLTPGQLAAHSFDGTAGTTIVARIGASGDIHPQLRVFGSDGALLCQISSYSNVADLGPCLLPQTGRYMLLANAFDLPVIGDYAITLQQIKQPGQARTLYVGRNLNGTLDRATIGTYSFSAAANSSVQLRMSALSVGLHSAIQIFSQDGTRLCSASSTNAATEIPNCLLPTTGTYTVLATSTDGSTGRYAIGLNCLTATCGALIPPTEYVYLPLVQH
jgi:hypothetical protein